MKFRIGLIVFIILIVLIGAAAFLLLPKGGSKNGIYFKTYDGVYAKITGTVRGGSNSITLSDLTYSEGAVPTADELASWQVNLEFGDSDEITITIRVENKNTDSLYVIFKDDNQTINNVTKTILNDGRTYNSGKIIILQSNSDTTVFTVNFRKNQDVITNIRYNYNIELKPELTYSDIQDGGVEAEEDSGYTFTYKDSNNTAEVTGLAAGNNTTILDIPSVVAKDDKVYTVTSIGNDAFADCINIISVTIPNGVVKLGNRVFKGCTRLTEINLSNTITTVGTYLFSGCTNLEEYNIPTSLRKLNSRMFENCTKITEFTFPANITTLGDYVFNGLSFETLTIPDTITTLTENTFSGIENIGELTLSYYVTSLGGAYAGLFANVANINKATIVLTDKGNELGAAFCGASTLKEVEISAGVTSIGGSAFRCCYAITSIEIPEGVESIGYR